MQLLGRSDRNVAAIFEFHSSGWCVPRALENRLTYHILGVDAPIPYIMKWNMKDQCTKQRERMHSVYEIFGQYRNRNGGARPIGGEKQAEECFSSKCTYWHD